MHVCIASQRVSEEADMAKNKPIRRISIRSIRRDPPDLHKLGRALIALAMAQAEAEAQATGAEAEKPEEEAPPQAEEAS
jgi:branched-subunit amino acid aminotransferase/4-amino-4-deoxychorismate lyase